VGDIREIIEKKKQCTNLRCVRRAIIFAIEREGLQDFLDNNPGVKLSLIDLKFFE
jgi:hypothetical protein